MFVVTLQYPLHCTIFLLDIIILCTYFPLKHLNMPLQPGCLPVSGALDQGQLLTFACQFFEAGLASNTRTTYAAGIRKYTNFCKATKLHILPASEPRLILFITHLATGNISQATIKVYLSAVRYIHVLLGLHNSFNQQLTP